MYEIDTYYHVFNRGCNKSKIFFNEENYRFLIRRLFEYSEKYNIDISAYCLMPNHYHLLLKQNSEITISKFLKTVFNSYTQAVNKQENRQGTLFEGRPKNVKIKTRKQLLHVVCYIHHNPVIAGLVINAEDWEFSDFRNWIETKNDNIHKNKLFALLFSSGTEYLQFYNYYVKTKEFKNDFKELTFE